MGVVSVLTPTYNRKNTLKKLYASLLNQDDLDFEWIIIDDGSTDGTNELVKLWINSNEITIKYEEKKNGGKHTALNYGYKFVITDLIFIVDSDDYLTSDAISTVKKIYNIYKNDVDLCGFSFLRGKPTGGYLSDSGVPEDGMKESYVECRINRHIGGDMAEVWYTKCLKEEQFPVFEGEKFLGEDLVWIKLSRKYKMRFFNKVIYISDYLEDGLTNNRRKHNILSPKGCVVRAEAFLESDCNIKSKIIASMQYIIYGIFSGKTIGSLIKESKHRLLIILTLLPAVFLQKKWKKEYRGLI